MAKERKIYTSFHDIPPREYMYFPKGTVEVSKPGSFSRTEIIHIIISIVVLTISFSFLLSGNNLYTALRIGFKPERFANAFVLSFIAIITAFFFHELSHKIIAQRQKLWAEYRMYPQGLIIAFFMGLLFPLLFAAPGAVMFMGGSKDHETGKIAVAGPLSNIIVAAVTFVLYTQFFFETSFIAQIIVFICFINAMLAMFNLLPFGPLDGVKIIRWSPTIWIILLIFAALLLVLIIPNYQLVY